MNFDKSVYKVLREIDALECDREEHETIDMVYSPGHRNYKKLVQQHDQLEALMRFDYKNFLVAEDRFNELYI